MSSRRIVVKTEGLPSGNDNYPSATVYYGTSDGAEEAGNWASSIAIDVSAFIDGNLTALLPEVSTGTEIYWKIKLAGGSTTKWSPTQSYIAGGDYAQEKIKLESLLEELKKEMSEEEAIAFIESFENPVDVKPVAEPFAPQYLKNTSDSDGLAMNMDNGVPRIPKNPVANEAHVAPDSSCYGLYEGTKLISFSGNTPNSSAPYWSVSNYPYLKNWWIDGEAHPMKVRITRFQYAPWGTWAAKDAWKAHRIIFKNHDFFPVDRRTFSFTNFGYATNGGRGFYYDFIQAPVGGIVHEDYSKADTAKVGNWIGKLNRAKSHMNMSRHPYCPAEASITYPDWYDGDISYYFKDQYHHISSHGLHVFELKFD